ncbi:MAG: hypothetical protein PW792_11130 [Acidobacteriaceae bacterium]|nr:hypothetical protein [Acidobacteriaceae bacterium]
MKWLLVASLALSVPVFAQKKVHNLPLSGEGNELVSAAEPEVVNFHFERKGLAVPEWSLEISSDGLGRYDEGAVATATRKPVLVHPQTLARMMGGVEAVRAGTCESSAKSLATKRLAYRWKSGDVWSTCAFHVSSDAKLNDAMEAFVALQQTLQVGEVLARLEKADPSAVPDVVVSLWVMAQEGSAIELGNIEPVLKAIANNDHFAEGTTKMARELLAMAAAKN